MDLDFLKEDQPLDFNKDSIQSVIKKLIDEKKYEEAEEAISTIQIRYLKSKYSSETHDSEKNLTKETEAPPDIRFQKTYDPQGLNMSAMAVDVFVVYLEKMLSDLKHFQNSDAPKIERVKEESASRIRNFMSKMMDSETATEINYDWTEDTDIDNPSTFQNTCKIGLLYELGVLEFLKKEHNLSNNQVAKIISSVTDMRHRTAQPAVNAVMNGNTHAKSYPLTAKSKEKIRASLYVIDPKLVTKSN